MSCLTASGQTITVRQAISRTTANGTRCAISNQMDVCVRLERLREFAGGGGDAVAGIVGKCGKNAANAAKYTTKNAVFL